MSDFAPESPVPGPTNSDTPVPPYRGLPDHQRQPFDPYQAPPQQATWSGAPAPTGTPAPIQDPAWGPPPPVWDAPVAKKRKVWPWIVAGVGALFLLGIVAIVALYFVGKGAIDASNSDYDAPVVTAADVATEGGTLVIADGANVAFEVGPGWTDSSDEVLAGYEIPGDVKVTYMGAWATADPYADPLASLTLISAAEEKIPVIHAALAVEHESYISSFLGALPTTGVSVSTSDSSPATTASGLRGLHSVMTIDANGVRTVTSVYTFARAKNVVFLTVYSYDGSDDLASAQQLLDTLRIDD